MKRYLLALLFSLGFISQVFAQSVPIGSILLQQRPAGSGGISVQDIANFTLSQGGGTPPGGTNGQYQINNNGAFGAGNITANGAVDTEAGQFIISLAGTATNPALAFSTCGTNCGLFTPAANQIELAVNGGRIWDYNITNGSTFTFGVGLAMGSQSIIQINTMTANNGSGYELQNQAASATTPTLIPNRASTTTGFGAQASGNISAIVAATEVARFVAGGLILPTVATGTPAASLCIDASNNVIKKTTTGSCI